jgi:hypothetical protein
VVLVAQAGEELIDPPGRDLLVSDSHTFAELATTIDGAFARWDRSHLHEFGLVDGRRIGMIDEDGREDDAELLDDEQISLRSIGLRPGDAFEYVFDLGDSWEHRCTVLRDDVDPMEELGGPPSEIVAIFGWGTIPDQYGRTTPDDDDE